MKDTILTIKSLQTALQPFRDAILNAPQAVQLVARLDGNFLEMDKTLELMSELDKDEFIRKKIICEL